jgi:hypothetical protein
MECLICTDNIELPVKYCNCKTIHYHEKCLIAWINQSKKKKCSVCQEDYDSNSFNDYVQILDDFSFDDYVEDLDDFSFCEFVEWIDILTEKFKSLCLNIFFFILMSLSSIFIIFIMFFIYGFIKIT